MKNPNSKRIKKTSIWIEKSEYGIPFEFFIDEDSVVIKIYKENEDE